MNFTFQAKLWLYQGDGAWVFATLPEDVSSDIKELAKGAPRKGFGSVKVSVSLNGVEWKTSIFPDSKLNAYILPVKKAVRKQANVSVDNVCKFTIALDEL